MNLLILLLVTAVYGPLVWRCIAAIRGNNASRNWDAMQASRWTRWIYARTNRERYLREEKGIAWFGVGVLVPTWSLLLWFVAMVPLG